MFRVLRGVRVAPDRQGLLYFICRNYREQPPRVRRKIDRMCQRIGGGEPAYTAALFDALTTHDTVTAISLRHAVSPTKIYELRRAFYEDWYRRKDQRRGQGATGGFCR